MELKKNLHKWFAVSYTRRSCITGGVVTVLLLLLTGCAAGSFFSAAFSQRILLFVGCLLAPLPIGALIAFRVELKQPIARQCFETALLFLLPVVTITMTETLSGVFVYDMTYFGFIANYILILLFTGLIYALSGSYRLAVLILNPVLFALALTNHLMMLFRGSPFVPMDFFSLKLADTIVGQYEYQLNHQIVTALLLLAFLVVVGVRMHTPKFGKITKIIARSLSGAVFLTVLLLFFFTSAFARIGVAPDFWNQARGYRNYGFFYSFFINTKYLYVLEPSGYDPKAVEGYVEDMLGDDPAPEVAEVQPDVICIMNESLADLSVLGDIHTNTEVTPFISSLRENTVRGNLYVPVIGAGTANTEFEFLTGNSMAFLPSGSNAYILYVKEQLPALACQMQAQNYAVTALHPYYARGWNRVNVYDLLGFHRFFTLDNLFDTNVFSRYQQGGLDIDGLQELMEEAYPGKNILMRQFVRDSYNYELLIDDYEQRDPEKPYFMFNVTMQNHGGYRADASNFPQNVWLTDTDEFPETNRYLSLLQHADDAFRDLIAYFETVDRPVVICMFGDHQPAIEEAFVERTLGTSISRLSLEQQQARHVTPFLIWANYDIEEQEIERLSVNYLSALLAKTAGLQMSDYQRYLLKLSETLPVIDTVGYIDSAGVQYAWSGASPYKTLLQQYEHIQYNGLLDTAHRRERLFYVPSAADDN